MSLASSSIRIGCLVAFAAAVGLAAPPRAQAQTTYTWNVTGSGSWTTAASWTPARNSPASSDILVINGSTTPAPTITGMPTQTIGRLRVINNADVNLQAPTDGNTLTITGGAAPNFEVQAGSALTLSNTKWIGISLTGSATATIAGTVTLTGDQHRLLASSAGAYTIASGGAIVAGASFSGNVFGNSGTANVATFQSGSSYTHIEGSDVHGLAAPSSKVVFQAGSTAIYRLANAFTASGRTYGNLTFQNNVTINTSGTGNFQCQTLTVESGSRFTHTGSGSAIVTVSGNILAAGSQNFVLTAGSGGVQFNGGGTQTLGGGGSGTFSLSGGLTVANTTTLAITRAVTVSGTATVNGTLRLEQGGSVSGGTFVYAAAAALAFANTSGSITVSGTPSYWPSASGPANVHVLGAGGITMGVARTVGTLLEVAGPIGGANQLTVNGTLRLQSTGSVTGSPTYGPASTLEYKSPRTVQSEWGSNATVGAGVAQNVTLDAGAGNVTLPTTDRYVPGNLTITSGTLELNAGGGALFLGGNWTRSGGFTPNGRPVEFNGSGTQTISRSGGETFSSLRVNKSAGTLVLASSPATPVSVSGTSGDVLTLATTAAIDLNGNTLTFTGTGGTLRLSGASGARSITGTGTVLVSGQKSVAASGAQTLAIGGSVTLRLGAPFDFGAGLTTVHGTLQLDPGSSVTNAPTHGAAATLRYQRGGTHGTGPEWSATSGAGYPTHVVVDGNTVLQLGSSAAARQVAGNLTVAVGSTLSMNGATPMAAPLTVVGAMSVPGTLALSTQAGGDLALRGNLTLDGTVTPNGRWVVFQNGNTQTVSRASGTLTLDHLRIAKTAGSVVLAANVTLTGTGGGNALEFSGTVDQLDLAGRTLTLGGPVGGTNANGELKGSAASALALTGSGAFGSLRFTSGSQTLGQLTVNLTGGSATLATPLTVNTQLTLTDGRMVTGAQVLTVASGGTVSRASGFVEGLLRKSVATGAPTVTFEVGNGSAFTPVTAAFASVGTGGTLTASTTNGDHPSLAGSGLDVAKSVNRYWTLTQSGLVFTTCDLTFGFVAGDVDAGAVAAEFAPRRFASSTWSIPATGAVTSLTTQATGVTAFGDFAVGEPTFVTVTSSSGSNGSVFPTGAVSVRHGSNVTFNISPDPGYHVQDVLVDGGSVGAVSNYTFNTVTAPHTIQASFVINSYSIIVNVVGTGSVTKSPDQPTYTHGSTVELSAIPGVGYQFAGWSGDATGTANPLTIVMTGTRAITATFTRLALAYERLPFSAPYTPISTGTGASTLLSAANDSTRSIALPFAFTYSGVPYTTGNFLAVNANGHAFFSRSSVTASSAGTAANASLYTSSPPNGTLAPWYDDLSVAAVGSNPAGRVLYQTQGAVGSRTLTVQWTGVSSFATTSGGQPRTLNFQLVLFESTHRIEFRYGSIGGSSSSTFESGSIGLEDSVGGTFLDAVTGSKATGNGMMTTSKWPIYHFRFVPTTPGPIGGGTYTVGPGGFYTSLSEAVADVNHRGVSGAVTLQLIDALNDTTIAHGGNVFPILLGPVSGLSAANTLTIRPAAGTATVSYRGTESGNCVTQVSGTAISNTNEPVFGIVGADYVTVKSLRFVGGSQVDRGVLLIPSSRTDGAQHVALEDVGVTLDRANTNSVGIQQALSVTPTTFDGTNSFNAYRGVTVRNAYAGLALTGNSTTFDDGCSITGLPGIATEIGDPATASDIGNGTPQTYGIRANNQSNLLISTVIVRNVTGTGTSSVDGIAIENLGAFGSSNGTCQVYASQVHDLTQTNANGGRVTGIRVNVTTNAASVCRVFNNFVHSLHTASTVTASRRLVGIMAQDGGSGSGGTIEVDFNTVRLEPLTQGASNACFELGTTSGPVVRARNNVFANFTDNQTGQAKHYATVTPTAGSIGPAGSVSERNVLHVNQTGNGYVGLAASTDKAGLADWQGVAGNDVDSRAGNPRFASPSNLHIQAGQATPVESAASFFGGAIGWVPDDIDGNPRHPTSPDIGADEGAFSGLGTNDVSVTALIEPPAGAVRVAGISFAPRASFENRGTTNQTNVPVRFRIVGPSPSTNAVYDQPTTIASMASGSTQTITFPSASLAIGGTYTASALSELPGDVNPGDDVLSANFEIAPALSGDYPVGAGRAAPFNTLTNAVARLNTVGVSGATRFLLEDASYPSETFPITIQSFPGAGPTRVVTIRPAAGASPVLQGSSAGALVLLNGADYVAIDGSNTGGTSRDLTLRNTNAGAASAVVWGQTSVGGDPATFDEVRNAIVEGGGATQIGVGFGGVSISAASNGTGNHNNAVRNCVVRSVQHGIYTGGASAANKNTGTVIERNVLGGAGGQALGRAGIVARFEDGVRIEANVVESVASAGDIDAVGIAVGMLSVTSEQFLGDEVTNALVARNTVRSVVSTHPNGLSAAGITVAPANSGITTIVNNMVGGISSPATDPDFTVGILVGSATGSTTRVWFNSVWMSGNRGAATAPGFALAIGGTPDPALDIRNNIFRNTQTANVGDSYAIGLSYIDAYVNMNSNFNDLQIGAGNGYMAVVGGLTNSPDGDLVTLTNWRNETGDDMASVSVDPLFISTTDLHVTGTSSPIANQGNVIASVTSDLDGPASDRTVSPDLGADETGTFALQITVTGSGGVALNPNQTSYAPGTNVQLTATPSPNWHFVGWSGDASGSANPTTVTMNGHRNVTAIFAIDQYALTVNAGANGSVTLTPDHPLYDHGSPVQLRAVPDPGYHLVAWGGDATGSLDTTTVVMDGPRTVSATFAINSYALTLNASGNGNASKTPDQAQYVHGTAVTLTATPAANHHFVGWSGSVTSASDTLTVIMDGPKTITGTFAIDTWALAVNVTGSGTVDRVPDLAQYDHGTAVTLTAVPAVGHHFVAWGGDASGSLDTTTVLMTAARTVTATFAINTYALAVDVSGNGTVSKLPDQPDYTHGTAVTLTATPAVNHHFVAWGGDASGTLDTTTVLMTAARTVTATFAIDTYALAVNVSGNGNVSKSPDQAQYDHGTAVTLTATPVANHHFVGWGGDASGTLDTTTVLMTAARTVTATFAIDTYALAVNVSGNGNVTKAPDQAQYPHGAAVTLTALPAANHHFVGWGGDASGNLDTTTVLMTAPRTVTATFAIDTYALTVNVSGNGAVAKAPDQAQYDHGTAVTLTATPAANHHFIGWSGAASGSLDTTTVIMNAPKTVTATFAIDSFEVATSVLGNGAVIRIPNQPRYPYGTTLQVRAIPGTGQHFVEWSGDASGTNPEFNLLVDAAKTVTARFEVNLYTLAVGVTGNGSVARIPDQATYAHGTTVLLDASPAGGWHLARWEGDGSGNADTLAVTMDGNKSITGVFTDTYTLEVAVLDSGSVMVAPDQPSYTPGSQVQLTATPASPNYHFVEWQGDATGFDNPLTLTLNDDMSVVAVFAYTELVPPTVQVESPNGGELLVQGATTILTWNATDNIHVVSVDLLLSRSGPGGPFELVRFGLTNFGTFEWVVTGPPTANAVFRVLARDANGNTATDDSDAPFTIIPPSAGVGDGPVTAFLLAPVHPNPSAGPARLRYALPEAAAVRLTVVDLQGREVARLVSGEQSPGWHELVWRGQTAGGRAAPGLYFVRFDSPAGRQVRRLVLTR